MLTHCSLRTPHCSLLTRYRARKLRTCAEDAPLVVQFCGNDPTTLAAAARLVRGQGCGSPFPPPSPESGSETSSDFCERVPASVASRVRRWSPSAQAELFCYLPVGRAALRRRRPQPGLPAARGTRERLRRVHAPARAARPAAVHRGGDEPGRRHPGLLQDKAARHRGADGGATLCDGGCNPMRRRLQLHMAVAATLCDGGCNPMRRRLQPYTRQPAP
jgi:hypothetical protein